MRSNFSKLIRGFVRGIKATMPAPIARHPSSYAYEYGNLINRLHWGRFKSAKEFLEAKDEEFQRYIQKFEATSAAATYSPHRPLEDTSYFVTTEIMEDLNILIPYDDGTIKATHVVHVGPKGSGKTTAQNQWLMQNHEALEKKKVFYVRCDAPKIFEFWEQNIEKSELCATDALPTVEEYFDFQTLYILAKYKDKGLPGLIHAELQNQAVTFDFKEARAVDAPDRSKKNITWYLDEHIAKNIEVYEKGDPERSYLRDSLFVDKPTRRREYFRWKECANAVRKWMKDNGFISLRILDGVDNLHINTEAGKCIFNSFVPEIRKFILRSAQKNEIRFAVMRNRTWIEVLNRDPITLGSGSITNPRVINHTPPNTEEISAKRIAWLKKINGASECARVLEATTREMPIGNVLHNNIRTFIMGAASLGEQVRFRFHQLGGQIETKRQASIQMKRNLFLNGRFYLSTQRDFAAMNREKGLPFINPFWFPDDLALKSSGRDPLFLRIRLLELLNTSDMLQCDLVRTLIDVFSYSESCVLTSIDDARAFGLIDSKSEHAGISNITFEISEMGRYLLTDLLCDIDVLYMLALDTRLPKYFFENGLIQIHTNHMHQRSGYIGAAAVTVYTFITWLSQSLHKELGEINVNIIKDHYTQEFLSNDAIKRITSHFTRMIRQAEDEDWNLINSKCDLLASITSHALPMPFE